MGFAEPACHQTAGELLPHRFTLTAAVIAHVGLAVYSLLHFPSGYPAWPLASILPFGVRTFLELRSCDLNPRQPAGLSYDLCLLTRRNVRVGHFKVNNKVGYKDY